MSEHKRPARGEGKEALVDAAIAILTEEGLTGLTYRSVADRAGVTHGLVRHHFRTLSELLRTAFTKWSENSRRVTELEPGTGDPRDIARSLPEDVRASGREHLAMFELAMHAGRGSELRPEVQQIYYAYVDAVQRELQRAGLHADRARPLARVLFAAIDGLVLQQLIFDEPLALEQGLAEVREIVAALAP